MRHNVYYDTEFIEDGHTIDLISIGLVTPGGREYYAVSAEFDQDRARGHQWLRENVWPHLPGGAELVLDLDHPHVKNRATIAAEVAEFILSEPHARLCAWYGAYDHVALCQLYGRMLDLPDGIPMWTYDLKARVDELGLDGQVPAQDPGGAHDALADARHNLAIDRALCLTDNFPGR
jgi:hypothetical protein